MKLIKNIALGLSLMGAVSLTSCSEDYLQTYSSLAISDTEALSSVDNLYLSLIGIHKEMVSNSFSAQGYGGEPGLMIAREALGDDHYWENLSSSWHRLDFLGWSAPTNSGANYNAIFWKHYYQWIMNANMILEGLETVEYNDAEEDLYNQVKGEALAIRAWAHFNLTQYYGAAYSANGGNSSTLGIVYRTAATTDDQARETTEDTYSLINADLDAAYEALSKVDFDSLGIPAVSHYTTDVVMGLKARVALTMHNYSSAATYAAKAIEHATSDGLALMEGDELFCGFADISTETDEAMYAATTADDQGVSFYSFYSYMSWNFSSTAIRGGSRCINADTYDTMSETDLRRGWWDPTGSDAHLPSSSYSATEYQNLKYEARATGNSVGDVPFMRLAEMYLICAEAYARSGNDASAQAIFSEFQVTRDPSYVAAGSTGDELIEEIMNSRRVELWGEGFRWFDLKRLGLGCHRGRNYDTTYCTFIDKDADADGWIWKIPDVEVNYNSLCEQNMY
ncbi:MAG: RagB/SusD family nutrient uptake outer membrane protein [Rikenellaceae bacterium]